MKIITPYIDDREIEKHKELYWEYDVVYEKDVAGIGSDLMFQQIWNKYPDDDIFILHADMTPHHDGWLEEVIEYVNKYPEAGMFGCLLLYPVTDKDKNHYIQSAGGKFTNNRPDHYGSGIILETQQAFKQELEIDTGQYDTVREVAWTTFGGCYLRRSFISDVGSFSNEYSWTYNRDVDYCLKGRELGWKIYQIPVRLFHHESKDNKRIKMYDNSKVLAEAKNLEILQNKWKNSDLYKTLDNQVV